MCVYVQIFIFCTQSHFGIVNSTKKSAPTSEIPLMKHVITLYLFVLERLASSTFYKLNTNCDLSMIIGF